MKFSIGGLMTAVSVVAWSIALFNTPEGSRGSFVAASMLVLLCILFVIAMTSSVSETGKLETEKNWLLQMFEPTFKTAGVVFIVAVLVLVVMFAVAILLVLGQFVTAT